MPNLLSLLNFLIYNGEAVIKYKMKQYKHKSFIFNILYYFA
jgi:hypothetical protein